MSNHRLPGRTRGRGYTRLHDGTTTNPIDVRALRARLRAEEGARAGIVITPSPAPARLALDARARAHVAAITALLALLLVGVFATAAVTGWRDRHEPRGWIKACTQCHGMPEAS